MMAKEKVDTVREYLRKEFPEKIVKERFEDSLQVQLFYLSGENIGVVVKRRFLENNSVPKISKHLERSRLNELLKKGKSQILIGNDGKLTIL